MIDEVKNEQNTNIDNYKEDELNEEEEKEEEAKEEEDSSTSYILKYTRKNNEQRESSYNKKFIK